MKKIPPRTIPAIISDLTGAAKAATNTSEPATIVPTSVLANLDVYSTALFDKRRDEIDAQDADGSEGIRGLSQKLTTICEQLPDIEGPLADAKRHAAELAIVLSATA